jgi:hypothetical protein
MSTYAYATKVSEDSYEVFNMLHLESPQADILIQRIDNALNSGLPITTLVTTDIPNVYPGAVWDGESFSGGVELPEGSEPVDIWDDHKKFSFLSENVLIANFAISNTSVLSDFMSEKFTGEVILVKVPEDQAVAAGETHGWDGSRFI